MESMHSTDLMTMAQPGLYNEPGRSAHYLEMLWPHAVSANSLKQALRKALKPRADVFIAIGFGADAWARLNPAFTPAKLKPFEHLDGRNGFSMPSTQSDIWFWIHGEDQGEVMDAVLQVHHAIRDVLITQLDLNGFRNKELRDLTGFIDGTANPKEDKRIAAAQIPLGEAGAGGSYVLTQKWQHNLKSFNQLSVPEQEQVIGRTKVESIELRGAAMPPTSHVSRTDVKIDGVGQKIYRRSTPYGNAEDHGLYFIGIACDESRIRIQLERMLGNTDDGHSDALMRYSRATTGAYWFLPSKPDLEVLIGE